MLESAIGANDSLAYLPEGGGSRSETEGVFQYNKCLKIPKISDSSKKRCRGELGKANAIAILFSILIDHKGFWNFLGCELYDLFVIGIREIFFCDGRNRCRIGVKDADDILNADVLIVSNVKIHNNYFLTI